MTTYTYFIYYKYWASLHQRGGGNSVKELPYKLDSLKNIRDTENLLLQSSDEKLDIVVISNFILLKTNCSVVKDTNVLILNKGD